MATVYKAYEPGLDRYVALKVLPQEFLHDEGFAERFRREAKVIARLEHPNIIPIHGFGIEETSRTPWMAMRLIAGGPLSSAMKAARLAPDRVVAVLRGVADALDYAHGRGVIHRDIKPQNILLDEAGRVYLADFGIAKMVEGSPGLTQTGMIAGTPQYMAPEQALAATVDNRADIYALGIVAYEMLTGRVPFAADTPVAVLMKHVQEPIPVPSPHDVPEPLTRALLKALAKRPEDRWATATAFVKELGDALAHVPTARGMASVSPTVAMPAQASPTAYTPRPGTPAGGVPYPAAYATAPPPPAPSGGPSRGLIAALVGAVVVMGVLATAALLVLLRPSAPGPPVRPPVTLRSPAIAEGAVTSSPVAWANDAAPGATTAEATLGPATTVAAPPTRTTTTVPAVRVARPTPAVAAEPPAPPPVAAPPALPAATPPPAAAAGFAGAGKVDSGQRYYEKTLTFAVDEPLALEATVGPVKVRTAQFSLADRRRFGEIDDLRSEMRAVFPVECRGAGSWDYKVQVELLDESGRRLDRFDTGGRCKDEIKTVAANHGILKALAAAVRGVKIRFEASRK